MADPARIAAIVSSFGCPGQRRPGGGALHWLAGGRDSNSCLEISELSRAACIPVASASTGVPARRDDGLVGGNDDAVIGWIREIVLNASDPWGLASFWAGLLGGRPLEWYPGWVTLEPPPHGQRLSFQAAGDGDGLASGVHFDILVGDLDAAQRRVIAAGGTVAGERVSPRPGSGGEMVRWRVCRDPEGHPFCLVTR